MHIWGSIGSYRRGMRQDNRTPFHSKASLIVKDPRLEADPYNQPFLENLCLQSPFIHSFCKPLLHCFLLGPILYLEELKISSTQILPRRNSHSEREDQPTYNYDMIFLC